MIELNSKAPDFTLLNQDDIEVRLKDFSGKWIVLYFYPKDNTPGCTTEACDFTEQLPEFEEINAVVLGVSADSTQKHRNFIEKKALKITLLSDPSTEMMQSYGVWGLKKNYGKEYMGIVRSTYIIDPEGVVKASWTKVRVKGHVETVKEKLKELQS